MKCIARKAKKSELAYLWGVQASDFLAFGLPSISLSSDTQLYRNFNHLFFWPEQYRRTGGMSIVFLFDENPDVASAGLGGV